MIARFLNMVTHRRVSRGTINVGGGWVITPWAFRKLVKCRAVPVVLSNNTTSSGVLILVPENPWTVGSNLKIKILGGLMVSLDYDRTAKRTGGPKLERKRKA
jgi:hypothetical protein